MRAASLLFAALSFATYATSGCSTPTSPTIGVGSGQGGAVGGGGSAPTSGVGGQGGSVVADETLCGNVALTATKIIPPGTVTVVCAGSTLTASAGVSLRVQGQLLVQGTAQGPVRLVGVAGGSTGWTGVVLESGGSLVATYLEIHNASTAVAAQPGSSYDIDHVVIDSSASMLVLSSNGTIAHGTLHGLGTGQSSTAVYISSASPHITNTVVSQGNFGAVDLIVVGGGASAPVFDHVEVADSHCAFHFNTANGAVISNSFVHHNAYGLMVIDAVNGKVDHNNFEDNDVNIGSCVSGTSEVADNYFSDGVPFGDGSCPSLVVTGVKPAGPYTTGVGPAP